MDLLFCLHFENHRFKCIEKRIKDLKENYVAKASLDLNVIFFLRPDSFLVSPPQSDHAHSPAGLSLVR